MSRSNTECFNIQRLSQWYLLGSPREYFFFVYLSATFHPTMLLFSNANCTICSISLFTNQYKWKLKHSCWSIRPSFSFPLSVYHWFHNWYQKVLNQAGTHMYRQTSNQYSLRLVVRPGRKSRRIIFCPSSTTFSHRKRKW